MLMYVGKPDALTAVVAELAQHEVDAMSVWPIAGYRYVGRAIGRAVDGFFDAWLYTPSAF